MKLTIDNVEYSLDVNKAKQAGCLEKVEPINCIISGDVFELDGTRLVIIKKEEQEVCLYGVIGGANIYTSVDSIGFVSRRTILDYLNQHQYVYIGNIETPFRELIDNLEKQG